MIEVTKNSFFVKGDPTFSILLDIVGLLHDRDSPVKVYKDKGYIIAADRGDYFYFYVPTNNNPFIHIFSDFIYRVSLDDVDTVSLVRKTVNYLNEKRRSTFLYFVDKKSNEMLVRVECTTV